MDQIRAKVPVISHRFVELRQTKQWLLLLLNTWSAEANRKAGYILFTCLNKYRVSYIFGFIFAHHCSKHTREICNLLGHSRGKKLTTVILHTREEFKITTYFMQFSFVVIFKIWFLGLHEFSEIPLHSNVFARF